MHGIGARAASAAQLIDDGARARSGSIPATARPLSARILRRPAPAHRDRPRAGAEAALHRARRADLGARHVACRPRSSTCCATCSSATGSPISSSATTCGRARAGPRGRGAARRQGRRARPAAQLFDAPQQPYTTALIAAAFNLEAVDSPRRAVGPVSWPLLFRPRSTGVALESELRAARCPISTSASGREIGNAEDIDAALAWKPPPGLLASLPKLKLIVSLGAGVDHLLADPSLPPRVADHAPGRSVHDRRDERVRAASGAASTPPGTRPISRSSASASGASARSPTPPSAASASWASASSAATRRCKLSVLGFDVAGWSRTERKRCRGIACFHGRRRVADAAGAQRHPGLPAAAHPGDRGHPQCGDSSPACRAAPRSSIAARGATSGRGRPARRARQRPALGGGRSTCSATSRCRRIIRSGAHPRITVTPHVAATPTRADRRADRRRAHLRACAPGKPLLNLVDRERGY